MTARDGGATALVGGRLLWTFGDTIFSPKSVDGTNLRSSTAALADPSRPLEVSEPVDANGAPYGFLPFTGDEAAYNASTGRPDLRIALWPVSVVSDPSGPGFAFYLKLLVKPGLFNYEFVGVGIARVAPGSTTGVRDSTLLFESPEPIFDNAMLAGSTVYVYGVVSKSQAVAVARVPLSDVADRSAYRFWNGSDWGTDPLAAKTVIGGVPGEVTVSYNAYLRRYLAVHSEVISNRIVMQSADRPEGPWSDPVPMFTGLPTSSGTNYAAREHPELAADGGRRVMVSYAHPLGPLSLEMRLVEVVFR